MSNDSRRSENEMDISFHVADDQFVCSLCSDSWLNNIPRCLPCENNHIFCSDCLLEFANSNNIKNGDNFFCPVCNEKHTWPEDGVEAFGIVNNDTKNSQSESDSSFMQDSLKCDTVEVLGKSFSLRSSHKDSRSFRERILAALEKLQEEREKEYKELENESKNLHLLINSKQQSLQSIINRFYMNKEDKLRHLLQQFSDDDDQEVEEEIADTEIEHKRDLINRMKTVFRSTIKFSRPNLIDNFNMGEVFLINNEDGESDDCLFQSTSEILTITSSKQAFYVLTEQSLQNTFIYRIFMLPIAGSKFVLIKSWTSDEKFHYKMAANKDLYLLEVGSSAGLMRLRVNGNKDLCPETEFERFKITVHKPSPLLRKIYSKTYSTNLACSDTTLVLVNSNGVLEKYSTEPLEKIRSMRLPAKSAVADIRCSNLYIIVLFQGGSVCYTYINSLKTNFEYLRKMNLSSIFDIEGFIIPPLKDDGFIMSDKSNVYNVNPSKSMVEYCSFTRVFKDVMRFDYNVTENHIFLYTITDSNAVIVNRFKL
ncbi:unnamed protein product [Dimorphilus gyrociliatus]|uniref:RING-type domain-containing protein n=1 Tax=Dimorphilus gyrociliatus TaxID=2664684 RepID=A0A7I8V813_9ANNE|nr:unnamed protein product [Dimorphilus gyrociliatus]